MKKVIFIYLLSALGFSLETDGQQPGLDSLYAVWKDQTQPDSLRVSAYKDYIWNGFLFSKPDSAALLAQVLHIFSKDRNYPSASAQGYHLQGVSEYLKGNYLDALDYYEKSLEINEKIGDDIAVTASLNNIGIIYRHMGQYPRALEYYNRALSVREAIGDKPGIATSLNNIGIIFENQNDLQRAQEYYEKALLAFKDIGDKTGSAASMNNIGGIYRKRSNYSQSIEYYEQALAILEEFGDMSGKAASYINIGITYGAQDNFTNALEYFRKSLDINEEIRDRNGMTASMINLGNAYFGNEDFPQAKLNCQRALDLAKEIAAVPRQKDACQCLYEVYKAMGNSTKALEFHEQMISFRDSLFNEENTKKMTRIEMQYEFDRKEAVSKAEQEKKDAIALEKLQQQKMVRNGFMGGFTVVLMFAGVFFMQRNRIGREKERSEELLLNILPAEVAEELKVKGEAEAKLIDEATVLFTDFIGFTEQSSKLSATELVQEINHCFKGFDFIIEKYGVEKIKTIGDSYMAAGGLPIPTDDSVKNTILVALEMQGYIQKRKAENDATGKPAFEMRVGIHTGPVVAGIVGVKKFQYDVWGDTVNTASRMEGNGEAGKVNISHSTYQLIKDDPEFQFELRGKVEAKGKGEMEMYFVTVKS